MDEQKCPVDIQMSIGHLAEVLDMYGNLVRFESFLAQALYFIACGADSINNI